MRVFPNSVFSHTPKTGGMWVNRAAAAAGVPVVRKIGIHCHVCHKPKEFGNRFMFGFIRHPLSWYQSYFCHRVRHGWTLDHIDRHCGDDVFDVFVRKVCQHYEGYMSTILIQRHLVGCDFVGRFESLQSDLARALDLAGEVFDVRELAKFPPYNVGDYSSVNVEYSSALKDLVMHAERDVLEKWYR